MNILRKKVNSEPDLLKRNLEPSFAERYSTTELKKNYGCMSSVYIQGSIISAQYLITQKKFKPRVKAEDTLENVGRSSIFQT